MTGIALWPCSLPMAIIGVTPANETPFTKGNLAPIFQIPRVCRSVARPAVNRLAATRKAVSLVSSPTAGPTIMGGATTPAYIAATCWRPLVNIFSGGSVSSTGCFSPVWAGLTAKLRNLGCAATAVPPVGYTSAVDAGVMEVVRCGALSSWNRWCRGQCEQRGWLFDAG